MARLSPSALLASLTLGMFVVACATPPARPDAAGPDPRTDPRGALQQAGKGAFLSGAPTGLLSPTVLNERDFVYGLAFAPSSDLVAFVHHVSTHMELTATGIEPVAPRFQQKVNASEFDCEDVVIVGDRIIVPSRQGTLRAFDANSGAPLLELSIGEPILRVALSPDQGSLALGTDEGRIIVVDTVTFAQQGDARLHEDEVRGLAYLADGRLLSAALDGKLQIVRLNTLATAGTQPEVHVPTSPLPSSTDRVFLAHLGGSRAVATLRDLRQPTTVISRAAVKRLELRTVDGTTLPVPTAEGTRDLPAVDLGEVHLRTLNLGAVRAAVCDTCVPLGGELVLGQDVLSSLQITEDVAHDSLVVRPSKEGGARMLDSARVLVREAEITLPGPATDLDANAAGVLVTFSHARAERSFDINDAERKGSYPPPSANSGAAIVDVNGKKLGRTFVARHKGFTVTGALSPDGRTVVTGGWDKRVLVFDATTGELVTERSLAWLVRRVRITPDGRLLGVAAWTPVSVLNEGKSEPSLLLYPLELDNITVARR